jgi:hypothetical protein
MPYLDGPVFYFSTCIVVSIKGVKTSDFGFSLDLILVTVWIEFCSVLFTRVTESYMNKTS